MDHENSLTELQNARTTAEKYYKDGNYLKAINVLASVVQRMSKDVCEEQEITTSQWLLTNLYIGLCRLPEARDLLNRIEASQQRLGPIHHDNLRLSSTRAHVEVLGREYETAELTLKALIPRVQKEHRTQDRFTLQCEWQLAEVLYLHGKIEEANPILERLMSVLNPKSGEGDQDFIKCTILRAEILVAKGYFKEGELVLNTMAERQGKTLGPHHPERQPIIESLAQLKAYQECFAESNTMFEGMIESYTQTTGPDSYSTLKCRWLRAYLVLARSGKVDEAVAELRELEGLHYVSPVLKRQIQESLQYLSSENTSDKCRLCSKTMEVGRISKMRCGHSHHYKCIEEHRRQEWWLEGCPTCGRSNQIWRTGQSLSSQQE